MKKFISKHKILFTLFSIIMVISMVVFIPSFSEYLTASSWNGDIADSFHDGNGNYNDPYIINNGDEFAYLLALLNSDNYYEYYNKYYEIDNNINFNNIELPIVNKDVIFSGNINGNGYTLSNINISSYYLDGDGNRYYNLFGNLDGADISYINFNSVLVSMNNGDAVKSYGSIFGYNVNDSDINNISIYNTKFSSEYNNVEISALYINDLGNNNISNINLDIYSSNKNTRQLIYNYDNADIDNVMYKASYNVLEDSSNIDGLYKYSILDNEIVFDNYDNSDDVIDNINNGVNYEWYIDNDVIKIRNAGSYNNILPNMVMMLGAPVGSYFSSITEHTTGIDGTTLYINNFTKDLNYLESLNYTEIIDGDNLPGVNTHYYDSEYLVRTRIEYSGEDMNDSTIVGHVSPTESVNTYVYFKYYPLERDEDGNLLTINGDYYIKIELIDNPFSARPTNKGFNGWATDFPDAIIEYDSEIYTRYLIIPVGDEREIQVKLNAIWTDANIQTGSYSLISSFDNVGMKAYTKTIQIETTTTTSYDCNPTFTTDVDTISSTTPTGRVRNNNTIPAGSYYYIGSSTSTASTSSTFYYASTATTCSCSTNRRCNYFTPTTISEGTSYNSSTTYRIMSSNGSTYSYTTDASDFIEYDTCYRTTTTTTDKTVSKFEEDDYTIGFFYSVGTNYTANNLYYDSNGVRCNVSGNTCSAGAYKLIQYEDSTLSSAGSSVSVASLGSDGYVADGTKYYYLVTRDMNILVNTSSGSSLTNYVSTKPYTLTSTYDGSAITNYYVTTGTVSVEADMVIENIKINGPGSTSASENTSSNNSISANCHNFKIGRNVFYSNTSGTVNKNATVLNGVSGIGSDYGGSSSNPDRYKVMVESGAYNYLISGTSVGNSTNVNTYYIRSTYVYGSDYDNALNDNSNLLVYFNALSSVKDNLNYVSDKRYPTSSIIVKSGRYGKTSSDGYANDNTYGIYVGGRTYTHYANSLRLLKVEGGDINIINGGPCVTNNLTSNSVAIYMTGGTVREIYGGAGTTTTYGNRLVSISGGTVTYSVFGGSDAYDSGSEGLLTGSTLVYIGGNAIIGDDTLIANNSTLYNVGSGHVFGAGNGADGGSTAGIVTNSHIIINGGEIKGSVYGGGNHGSVGTKTSTSTATAVVIDLLAGQVNDSVFGAGESFGGGSTSGSGSQSAVLKKDYYTNVNTTTSSSKDIIVTVTNSSGTVISGPTTTHSDTTGTIPANAYLVDETQLTSSLSCTVDVVGATLGTPTTTTTTESVNCVTTYNQEVTTIPTSYTNRVKTGNTVPSGSYYTKNNSSVGNNTTLYLSTGETCSVSGFSFSTRYCYYFTPTTYDVGDTVVSNIRYIYSYNGNYRSETDSSDYTTETCDTKTTVTVSTDTTCKYAASKASAGDTVGTGMTYYEARDNDFVAVTPQTNTENVNTYNHSVTINLKGTTVTNSIYGGANKAGTLYGNVDINLYSGSSDGVYGGGKGVSGTTGQVVVLGDTNISSDTDDDDLLTINSVYGGSALGTVNTYGNTEVDIDGGTFTDVFGGGMGDNATAPINNGNIKVTIKNGEITNVYGGNNISGIPSGDVSVYLKGGTVANTFGGGSQSSVTTTNVYMQGITECGNIFGGSNTSGTVTASNVYLQSGECDYVFGGNNAGGTTTDSYISGTGGTVTEIYGGGKDATTGSTYISLNGTAVTNVYGGGQRAPVTTDSTIIIDSGDIGNVYGGSNVSGNVPETNITANGGSATYIYGGGKSAEIGESNVTISGITATNVFGGGEAANVTEGSNITMTSGSVTNMYGGSNTSGNVTVSNITATGGTITTLYGGNNAGGVTATTNIDVSGAMVTTVYGGGSEAVTTTSNVNINSCGGVIANLFGGGRSANVTTTNLHIKGCTITNAFGGSNTDGIVTNSNVYVGEGVTDADNIKVTNLYGGNNDGGSTTNTIINIYNGTVTNTFGGGNNALVNSDTNINITTGKFTDIYGGGNNAAVNGSTNLNINGGVTSHNIYGGGNEGTVTGSTTVVLSNATINGSAYAGGNGSTATVFGNTNISTFGTTTIGTSSCVNLASCSLFGGGNAAYTGSEDTNNSTATVNIAGLTLYGNVYGGANTSRVYGATNVTIGQDVSLPTGKTRGDILIKGSIFGGGEANASGSNVYDFRYISVTNAIDVNINGQGYTNFEIDGSIFGSGNASSTSGVSNIEIKNYGTLANPKRNVSIQRTDLLVIDNSAILLTGATDRTNEYSSVLFSLSRIDELQLANNSTLFLENNANLLKSFRSLVDTTSNTLAAVTIDPDTDTFTRNVNNRLYMKEGQVLNISTAENVNASNSYGDVHGMTFFGMYKYSSGTTISTGIYGDYGYKDTLSWGGVINNSSYVVGKHYTNHDITVDGFYTNYIDNDTSLNMIDYIDPTPKDSQFYRWLIGGEVTNVNVDLEASKYSTLGAKEVAFIDFTDPNTSFSIVDFDYSELASGISLVTKSNIPRVADTANDADTIFGLSIESGTGWLTNGQTSFINDSDNKIIGTRTYAGDSTTNAPSLLFYLYHSKNISTTGNMGVVKIVISAVTKIDDLTNDVQMLVVNINLSRKLITDNDYEGSMTSGRKYELFASTVTNVTNKSSISAYYSLYATGDIYRTGYHRALVSNTVLPLNTKITMIDLSGDNPNYYYHVINSTDVTNATTELATEGDIRYDLSMFEVMGAYSSGVYYDDASMNSTYYHSTQNYSSEEFIFILDFEDTNITTNMLDNNLLIEMLDSYDETIIGVLGIERDTLVYNLYSVTEAKIELDGTLSVSKIYSGNESILNIETTYTQEESAGNTIIDTLYGDYKMGLKLALYNSNGEIVSGTSLVGFYYEIDGIRYAPNIDGTTRINVADKVGNWQNWIKIATGNSNLATGTYTLKVDAFGSADGIYYGLSTPAEIEFDIDIVNEIYGLDINTSEEEMILDAVTGYTLNENNIVKYNISYNSGLTNPNIHVKLYRRDYSEIYSANYLLVDLADYVTNTLSSTSIEKEYLVVSNPNTETSFNLLFNTNLLNGTYKIEFILYDGSSMIDTVDKYFVIK